MQLIDQQYMQCPFFGSRRMALWLQRQGYQVNRKRVQRLMRLMGLKAVHPRRKGKHQHPEHNVYPYLLRGLPIIWPDQVWCSDITYIPLRKGFMYLVAIMDWFSRYVLAWQLSNTLTPDFCIEALEKALRFSKPYIFNTDQGSQFTSDGFISVLRQSDINISMDGRGRVIDNIFIERLWRSLKYEEIYIKDYEQVPQLLDGLGTYFPFYNHQRPHQGLRDRTPAEVYFSFANA